MASQSFPPPDPGGSSSRPETIDLTGEGSEDNNRQQTGKQFHLPLTFDIQPMFVSTATSAKTKPSAQEGAEPVKQINPRPDRPTKRPLVSLRDAYIPFQDISTADLITLCCAGIKHWSHSSTKQPISKSCCRN